MDQLTIPDENPTYLYHYTSIQTLFNILKHSIIELERPDTNIPNNLSFYNIQLWGSHISYMNDPSENNFYFNALKKALEDYEIREKLPQKSPYLLFGKELFEQFDSPYIVSLCDDEYSLSMWRCYGANACGVAIAFSCVKLKEFVKQSKIIELRKVTYEKEEEIIKKIKVEELRNVYESITTKELSSGSSLQVEYNTCLSEKLSNKIDIKHQAYSDEKEWRLIIYDHFSSSYEERNGLIVPYHYFDIPLNIVEKIIIGPCAEQTLNKISLERFLADKIKGLNLSDRIAIETSDLPYIIR